MIAAREIENNDLIKYLDTAASIVMVINPNHSIELINRKGCEVLGYSHDELIGKDWFNCCIPKNEQRDLALFFDQIIHGTEEPPDIFENWVVAKGNQRKLIQWRNSLLKADTGAVTGLISSGVDITELVKNRKALEQQTKNLEGKVRQRTRDLRFAIKKLEESNPSLKEQITATEIAEKKVLVGQMLVNAIAENFPKGVIMVFDSNYVLVYMEGEELKRLGLRKGDFEGVGIDSLSSFNKKQRTEIKKEIRKTLDGKAACTELNISGQNYVVNSTPLFSDTGTVLWAVLVYSNVTEQKQIQQRLEKALQTERELNELKSRFISMASHEFRTPLSAILSSATLIGKLNEPGNEERRLKHVQRIRSNVHNLVVILNDFLSLDKLDEGKIEAVPKPFELVHFVKMVLQELESIKKLGQQMVLEHPDTPIPVYLDPKLLSHVIINLITNAIKYSDEGLPINIHITDEIDEAVVIVSDKGMGIPLEEQKYLFERFFRASNAMNIQGTGLGLHIVKQYLELMNGTIRYISVPGEGTSFTLRIPKK